MTCPDCLDAMKAVEDLDRILASLSQADVDGLLHRDPDDPRTFALDAKGRP